MPCAQLGGSHFDECCVRNRPSHPGIRIEGILRERQAGLVASILGLTDGRRSVGFTGLSQGCTEATEVKTVHASPHQAEHVVLRNKYFAAHGRHCLVRFVQLLPVTRCTSNF